MGTHSEPEITVAAYLWCKGFRFVGCTPDNNRRGRLLFEFEDEEGRAAQARRDYLNGGTVMAKEFATALSGLKSELYAAKNGDGDEQQKATRDYR